MEYIGIEDQATLRECRERAVLELDWYRRYAVRTRTRQATKERKARQAAGLPEPPAPAAPEPVDEPELFLDLDDVTRPRPKP